MELIKKQLQEEGYAYFNMNDYSIFSDDISYYSKYICNESKNLKKELKSIRVDGPTKDEFKSEFNNKSVQINNSYSTWEEAKAAMDEVSLKMDLSPSDNFLQKWYHFHNPEINEDFLKLTNKIVRELYDVDSELSHNSSITYYGPGCLLRKHQDGIVHSRLCVILIYLNDSDYKSEWGGNLLFNDNNTISPLFGNVVVLDFTTHNAWHEVDEVIDGYGRYAFLSFVSIENN